MRRAKIFTSAVLSAPHIAPIFFHSFIFAFALSRFRLKMRFANYAHPCTGADEPCLQRAVSKASKGEFRIRIAKLPPCEVSTSFGSYILFIGLYRWPMSSIVASGAMVL